MALLPRSTSLLNLTPKAEPGNLLYAGDLTPQFDEAAVHHFRDTHQLF